jgi:hypothetical protein
MQLAEELYRQKPGPINADEHEKTLFKLNKKGLLHCFSIVLLQEQERYNKLIQTVHDSLGMLIKAI